MKASEGGFEDVRKRKQTKAELSKAKGNRVSRKLTYDLRTLIGIWISAEAVIKKIRQIDIQACSFRISCIDKSLKSDTKSKNGNFRGPNWFSGSSSLTLVKRCSNVTSIDVSFTVT
jgi:hypothetical protein